MKVVEIKANEFEEIVEELKKCKEERDKLKKANDFLNEQIKEYNKKFVKDKNENFTS